MTRRSTRRYAQGTRVDPDASRAAITRVVADHGGFEIALGAMDGAPFASFRLYDRHVRFVLPKPERSNRGPGRASRSAISVQLEREERRLWRALYILIRCKFEIVDTGIAAAHCEFAAYTIGDGGKTPAERTARWPSELAFDGATQLPLPHASLKEQYAEV